MHDVEFLFWIGDRVVTLLGQEGIVSMAAVDDGGKLTYFVKQTGGGEWWNEMQLKAKEEVPA